MENQRVTNNTVNKNDHNIFQRNSKTEQFGREII